MSIKPLQLTIKKTIKSKGVSFGFIASKIGVSEKTLSDWLGKNTTMDVTNLVSICNAVDYNFFNHLDLKVSGEKQTSTEKKAKVLITLEVENEEIERDILQKILDKTTVKKLLG